MGLTTRSARTASRRFPQTTSKIDCFQQKSGSALGTKTVCELKKFRIRHPLMRDSLLIRLWFYALGMRVTSSSRKQFVVLCKKCKRDVPAGVAKFPFQSIVVTCPLCREQRRYLPSETGLGFAHREVSSSSVRAQAGQIASSVPNVRQVLNESRTKSQKATLSN
jgi:hypothetical protein